MKLRTLLTSLVLLSVGCAGPGGRPITEELPLGQINALLKKNPDYRATIRIAERFRTKASTVDLARANDLTYDRLHEFLESYFDADVRNRFRSEGEQAWDEAGFGASYAKVDSLLDLWQRYLDENKPDSYVKVDLAGIIPAESSFGTARVLLDVIPLKGPVDEVAGSYGLFERNKSRGFGDSGVAGNNTFRLEKGLRTPTRIQAWMTYSIWGIRDGDLPYNMYPDRPGLPLKKLKEKYCFDYTITTLVKDGKSIRLADVFEKVPSSIRNYWSASEKELDPNSEYYYGCIAKELVDPDFVCCTDYARNYETDRFREMDPLAAWLMIDRY